MEEESEALESVKKLIVEWCKEAGCCCRCTLRLVGHANFDSYKSQSIVDQKLALVDESWFPKDNTLVCISCLNILSDDLIQESVQKITDHLSTSGYCFDKFHLNISVPANITLRHELIVRKLDSFLNQKLVPKFSFEGIFVVKDVFRFILAHQLQDKLSKSFDSATPSSFIITISFAHKNFVEECHKLFESAPDNFFPKRCKRSTNTRSKFSHFNHSAVLRAIDSIADDKQLICNWKLDGVLSKCSIDQINCHRSCIYLAGRYLKFSRTLSQTPWLIDGERKMESSVQDIIFDAINKNISCGGIKFSSSGREDVDVRMLGRGRPFVLEISDPKSGSVSPETLFQIQRDINDSTNEIEVRDLQSTTKEEVNIHLKSDEEEKSKTYEAVCCISRPLTQEDNQKLVAIKDLKLQQKTPIRVLHRRTLTTRERTVYNISMVPLEEIPENCSVDDREKLFKVRLTTEGGCYIKEFVHSDLGRTQPNLATILGNCATDILSLDVMQVNLDWPPVLLR